MSQSVPTPFLKWVGGKRQLLPYLLKQVPDLRDVCYHEPFVGGGALFFALKAQDRLGQVRLSDVNGELINAYRVVRDQVEPLIEVLRRHRNEEEYYYHVRSLDPSQLSEVERAARLIYLNKTCFNGLYRENRKGQFNVPFGRYASPTLCAEDTLRSASRALQGVVLEVASFEESLRAVALGDFVYLDPPYVPVSATSSFVGYSAGGFDGVAQARLAKLASDLSSYGVNVVASNSVAPLVRQLYEGFSIEEVRASRAVNSRGDRRGKVGELVMCAGPAFLPSHIQESS